MNKKRILNAFIDGIIQSFLVFFAGVFPVLLNVPSLSLTQYLLLGALTGLFSAVVFFILAQKESNKRRIIQFSLFCVLWFVLCTVILLIIWSSLPVGCLPLRELNNADGLLILFTQGSYILSSLILRLCIFLILFFNRPSNPKKYSRL